MWMEKILNSIQCSLLFALSMIMLLLKQVIDYYIIEVHTLVRVLWSIMGLLFSFYFGISYAHGIMTLHFDTTSYSCKKYVFTDLLWSVSWMIKFTLFMIYMFVSFLIFFTNSLWILYFSLELQWMLFMMLFIIGNSVWKGLMNYVIFNEMVGTLLIMGLILYMDMFFSALYYGKVGFYPFTIPMLQIVMNAPYIYLLLDPLNKMLYVGSFMSFFNFLASSDSLVLLMVVNFNMMYIFGQKFLYSIKSMLLVSSLMNFLLVVMLIMLNLPLFGLVYFFMYYLNLFFFLTGFMFLFVTKDGNSQH